MTGEAEEIDRMEIGDLTATLRFVEYEYPPHRQDVRFPPPRYSLRVEAADGTAEAFIGWGSQVEAEEQELSGTARNFLDLAIGDAMAYYAHGGRRAWLTHRTVSTSELEDGDLSPVFDGIADEWDIREPSEAIRTFRAVIDTARKFDRLGIGPEGLDALNALLHEAAQGAD